MSVRIAEYFGHNLRSTAPLTISATLQCPFSGETCSKYPRNKPVCSLWLDGTPERLYPVCQDRFLKTTTTSNVHHPHARAKIMEVAQCIWGAEIKPEDIAVTFGKAVEDGSKVDCIVRRKLGWEIAKFPNGFLVEIQASGDTSNTGVISTYLSTLTTTGALLPNGTVTAGTPIATHALNAGPSYKNVHKRAIMQIMSKGALAMASDLGIALVVNRVFLERLKTVYRLPSTDHHTGRDIVMLIPVDAIASTTGNPHIDLSVIPAEAVRLKWQRFIDWCTQEGDEIDISGNYSALDGALHDLP